MTMHRFLRRMSTHHTSSASKPSGLGRFANLEPLENRMLLSGTTVGIYAARPNASETNPLTSGRGVFIVKRPTGSTAKPITLKYYVRSTSTAVVNVNFRPLNISPLVGKVTIPAGKRSAAFNLTPIDDGVVSGDLTVVMSLKPVSVPIVRRTATVTIHNTDVTPTPTPTPTVSWFDDTRHYRSSIAVDVGSTARTDQPVDQVINFTTVLGQAGASGSLVDNSIRVMEVSADGKTVINNNVPFQFDKDSDFNASTKASGDLVLLLTGSTAANTTRHYQVYFDTTGTFNAASVTPLVSTTDNTNDLQGYNSVKIQTPTATYYYQKDYGGFSSIIDSNGADWVSWKPIPDQSSAGSFRGSPNLGPAGFHPGRAPQYLTMVNGVPTEHPDTLTTTIISSGPLKTTIQSTATISGNTVRWEIYPTFARCTVVTMDQPYWFLYEATPGGQANLNSNDTIVDSSGAVHQYNDQFAGNAVLGSNLGTAGEEWAYFANSAANNGSGRYMFYVHNNPDSLVDSYYDMDDNMTVFGFGRDNSSGSATPLMTASNNVFTLGLANGGGNFSNASASINGQYQALSSSLATGETKPA